MKTLRKLRLNPAWMLLAVCGWATLLLAPASASGQIVNVCSSGSVSYAEETVCVYGNFSSPGQVTATASAYLTECCYLSNIGVDLQLSNNGTLVADTGEPGSTYESTSVVPNGNGPYTATGWIDACYGSSGSCYWEDHTWSLSAAVTNPSILYPAYQVVSIVYSPPGNKSSDGYTNTTTNGTTTTIGSSFQNGLNMTFSVGWGTGSVGEILGTTSSTTSSTAFQENFTDASGIANAPQSTSPDAINHNQDLFLIWVNPQVSVVMNGSTPVSYSMGIQPTASGATPGALVLPISANVMEANAAGVSTVPATWLNQQSVNGQSEPGLAAICRNLNTAEYAAGTCTLADQCGCTPADFAPILQMDPLLYQNGTTSPINPYPGTMSPLNANQSTNCGTLPIPSGANCRYVPVPSAPSSTLQEVVTLPGPEYPGDNNSPNAFSQTENTQTTQTYGESSGESVGVTVKLGGGLGPSLTIADTFTWTNSQSTGTASGSGATLAVTLNSATVGCGQQIPVFEDTEFHTFVFQQPNNNDSCSAVPTFSPLTGTYASPQTVTISYPTTTGVSGTTIYYTTNGTTPTTSSSVYTGPITVSSTETIQAIATNPGGYANSAVGSAVYTIQ